MSAVRFVCNAHGVFAAANINEYRGYSGIPDNIRVFYQCDDYYIRPRARKYKAEKRHERKIRGDSKHKRIADPCAFSQHDDNHVFCFDSIIYNRRSVNQDFYSAAYSGYSKRIVFIAMPGGAALEFPERRR